MTVTVEEKSRQSEGGPAPAPARPAARAPARPARRPTVSGKKKPKKRVPPKARTATAPAQGSAAAGGGGRFEEQHARDERGVFTSGADLNRGSREKPAGQGTTGKGGKGGLKRGAQGEMVAQLQRILKLLGYSDDLPDDGTFGPRTEAALRRAQRNLGVEEEDGVLGPKTRTALRDELRSVTPDEETDGDGSGSRRGRRSRSRSGGSGSSDGERRSASREEGTSPAQMRRYREQLQEWAKAVKEWAKKQSRNEAGPFPTEPKPPGKKEPPKKETRTVLGPAGRHAERAPRPKGPPRRKRYDPEEA
jgi:hypothetical protein